MKYERKERGHYKGKSPKQGINSSKDLPIELLERSEIKGRSRHKNNNRIVNNLEERKVGIK